jgi:hypothetical protein
VTAGEGEVPPERIAKEAARLGHEIEWDDPAPVRAVKRWTCTRCGESAWCDAHEPDEQWGPVLDMDCRGVRLAKPARYSWASGRKTFGPPT